MLEKIHGSISRDGTNLKEGDLKTPYHPGKIHGCKVKRHLSLKRRIYLNQTFGECGFKILFSPGAKNTSSEHQEAFNVS